MQMPKKIIRLYFYISIDADPAKIKILVDQKEREINFFRTWSNESGYLNPNHFEIEVDAPYDNEKTQIPFVDLSISPKNGCILLDHAEQNYTLDYDGLTLTESSFSDNLIDIISQPCIDGLESDDRYNFSLHYGLGYGSGQHGMGNLSIGEGEIASFKLGYDFYRTSTST